METVKLIATSFGVDLAEPHFLLVDLCKLFTGTEPPPMMKRVVFNRGGQRHEVVVPLGVMTGVQTGDDITDVEAHRDAKDYVVQCLKKSPEILNHVTATVCFKGREYQDLWKGLLPHHSDAVGKDVLVTARVNFWLEFVNRPTGPGRFDKAVQDAANQIRKVFGIEREEQNSEAPAVS